MHGTFYPNGTPLHANDDSRSTTRKAMVLENMRSTFVIAKHWVLTNTIVRQEDTIG